MIEKTKNKDMVIMFSISLYPPRLENIDGFVHMNSNQNDATFEEQDGLMKLDFTWRG